MTMGIKYTDLDEDRLVRYLSTKLHIKSAVLDEKSTALQKITMIHELVNKADGKLSQLLSETSSIDDAKLRRWLRKGLLAQMYDVNEYDMNDGKPYISAANNHCALLQVPGETIILNTDGTVRPTAYPVKLLDATASRWGWITKEKGPDNFKRGLFSLEGYEMLPCEFDDIEIGDYNEPIVSIAGYRFSFIQECNIKTATKEKKEEIKVREEKESFYTTEDGNIFSFAETMAEEETMVLVMPGVRVSKEYAQRRGIKPASPVAVSKEDAINTLLTVMKRFSWKPQ